MMVERHTSVSPSPSRRSFSTQLSALGAKLSRTLSGDHTLVDDDDRKSIASTLYGSEHGHSDRSQSRGREAFHSSGRGGIGNIRQASASREARPAGPDDPYSSRGREPVPAVVAKTFSTGRGGAGNIRSPSRDINNPLSPDPSKGEREVIKDHIAASQDVPHYTGRGGAGNIVNRSRSRGPTAPAVAQVHSTGRGGAGNIITGDALLSEIIDEEERKQHASPADAWHSTGRGGLANMSANPPPAIERRVYSRGEYESTGRGGAGNIVRDRSASRPRA